MAITFLASDLTTRDPVDPSTRLQSVFWHLVLCCSLVYELILIYLLFLSASDTRELMFRFDDRLGQMQGRIQPVRVIEDYCDDCRVYDSDHATNPLHIVWDKCDFYALAHLLGWCLKMLILRDWWICHILSFSFEMLEYSIQHQLPNLCECWWDHWIMDFVVCNGLGIHLGMLMSQYLEKKMISIEWISFNWRATESLKGLLTTIGVMIMWSVAEVNLFFLLAALWIPPSHYLVKVRLGLYTLIGYVAIKQIYEYFYDKTSKRLGEQAWITIAIVVTELLVSLRINGQVMTITPPPHIIAFWSVVAVAVAIFAVWLFERESDDDGTYADDVVCKLKNN